MFLFCKCDDALLLHVVAGVGNGTGVIHVITLQLFYRLDYPMVLRRHMFENFQERNEHFLKLKMSDRKIEKQSEVVKCSLLVSSQNSYVV